MPINPVQDPDVAAVLDRLRKDNPQGNFDPMNISRLLSQKDAAGNPLFTLDQAFDILKTTAPGDEFSGAAEFNVVTALMVRHVANGHSRMDAYVLAALGALAAKTGTPLPPPPANAIVSAAIGDARSLGHFGG